MPERVGCKLHLPQLVDHHHARCLGERRQRDEFERCDVDPIHFPTRVGPNRSICARVARAPDRAWTWKPIRCPRSRISSVVNPATRTPRAWRILARLRATVVFPLPGRPSSRIFRGLTVAAEPRRWAGAGQRACPRPGRVASARGTGQPEAVRGFGRSGCTARPSSGRSRDRFATRNAPPPAGRASGCAGPPQRSHRRSRGARWHLALVQALGPLQRADDR